MIDLIDLVLVFAQEFAASDHECDEKLVDGGNAVIVEPRGKVERPVVGRMSDPVAREVPEGRSLHAVQAVVVPGTLRSVDRRKNPQTGEWEDYPNYIDCTMFGTRAEAVGRYISKGSKVAIEGKLRYSSWERDGQKRSKLEVIVDEIEFMNSRPAASPAAAVDGGQQYAVPEAPAVEVADEDIPF